MFPRLPFIFTRCTEPLLKFAILHVPLNPVALNGGFMTTLQFNRFGLLETQMLSVPIRVGTFSILLLI
ncbi:hypothetical protein [Listeria ivanovii]|uniref:hypothetical protein n=1 Tax=Listeria ivanovii TaxID=1638 RepID=UPI0002E7499E|nr:hypothetical protein [Listeria ivanovii]AHI57321.1 hypothetical protein AX25_13980 [Listeria ivanovii WSLC3009]MBK3914903.1 hypothetical protein [Listeria ivanovii subsp. ivanovii]MBK3921936.1 hypothetical protein [Listeria ivanovii subsp. ivanovii]